MKFKSKFSKGIIVLSISAVLAACGGEEENTGAGDDMKENMNQMEETENSMDEMDHSGMHMSGSGEVPEGLEEAQNPAFEEGDTAIITEAHMEGMKGAEAVVIGAYDTIAYSISYDPTNGGERVKDHKWIIHEEIEEAQETPYTAGDEVEVSADHMEGMEGAKAKIESAEETTVYMIDFTLESGEEVTNHKWVTEGELSGE
ncbi:YdhK family protein [Jeotgalibacillus sp. ET6]|uniref:YdhK family protein n=1 Tax=Jeotgalibacillus sp. ET6 TaxID=3037260 RepID=UPI00241857F4|nr:YdhK family protein [Jeotgalibacillus sp. ET6]MDG5472276.1 YdhK family protein [Jeotgalibacillus sp. ET6]